MRLFKQKPVLELVLILVWLIKLQLSAVVIGNSIAELQTQINTMTGSDTSLVQQLNTLTAGSWDQRHCYYNRSY